MTAHVSFPTVAEKFQVVLFSKYEEVLGNDHLSWKLVWRIHALCLRLQVEIANDLLFLFSLRGKAFLLQQRNKERGGGSGHAKKQRSIKQYGDDEFVGENSELGSAL